MIHKLNLMDKYFDLILSGEKVLEGRLNDEKRKLINIGDEIIFNRHSDNSTMVAVVRINITLTILNKWQINLTKKNSVLRSLQNKR